MNISGDLDKIRNDIKELKLKIREISYENKKLLENAKVNNQLIDMFIEYHPDLVGKTSGVKGELGKLLLDLMIKYIRYEGKHNIPFTYLYDKILSSAYMIDKKHLTKNGIETRIHQSLNNLEKQKIIKSTGGKGMTRMVYLLIHIEKKP